MQVKHLPIIGALALAAPAFGITVNMTGFVFGGAPSVALGGAPPGISSSAQAGEFIGTMDNGSALSGNPSVSSLAFTTAATSGTSFTAWCAELTQSFNFGVQYQYEQDTGADYFGTQRRNDLSRLFTAAQGFVVDSATSAAMQAGIWEIIYETGGAYNLSGGNFFVTPQDPGTSAAFTTMNSFLAHLANYNAGYQIDVLGSDGSQDFLIATVPEPETWAMLLCGLGAIGAAARRRRQPAGAQLTA